MPGFPSHIGCRSVAPAVKLAHLFWISERSVPTPVPIIMHGGDQSNFVAGDIEDCEFPDLVGVRKGLTQFDEIQRSALPHNRVRMLFHEFVQALSRNDMHWGERAN